MKIKLSPEQKSYLRKINIKSHRKIMKREFKKFNSSSS